ncbi:hypothetical protein [Streptomyces sp. ODS28]|uniref:sugar phosphate isomerase/epimerase family protein n=1 Tax=Streptomyces sp. ODS28 TaxID=3136688 RepID=UPI0031E5D738
MSRTGNAAAAMPLQITFDGLRPEQIDKRWVREAGGLEAYVFDGADLASEAGWDALRAALSTAADLGATPLTCHFPTENADWVNDPESWAMLRRFCRTAAEHGAEGVVLHANQFVQQADWLDFDVAAARRKVVARLAALDADLYGLPLWIGVENLPVIGAEGTDYDPVFVAPEDYLPLRDLDSRRIGATWDLCHWAVTYTTWASFDQLRQRRPSWDPGALPPVPVHHLHFASFAGQALPFRAGVCHEGVTPQRGDAGPELLERMLRAARRGAAPGASMVLEVQEEDYLRRSNCWSTREWLLPRLSGGAAPDEPPAPARTCDPGIAGGGLRD